MQVPIPNNKILNTPLYNIDELISVLRESGFTYVAYHGDLVLYADRRSKDTFIKCKLQIEVYTGNVRAVYWNTFEKCPEGESKGCAPSPSQVIELLKSSEVYIQKFEGHAKRDTEQTTEQTG